MSKSNTAAEAPPTSAFEYIGNVIHSASGKHTPEKYLHILDDLFADAAMDSQVEMVLVCRKGKGPAAIIGVKGGQPIRGNLAFADALRPVFFSLVRAK